MCAKVVVDAASTVVFVFVLRSGMSGGGGGGRWGRSAAGQYEGGHTP
jgi:hypothetical protein